MEKKNEELLVAVRQGDCSGIERLVELGADVNTQCEEGKTPLILASSFGYETCVGLLICLGADVNKSDYSEGGANFRRSPGQLKRLLAENMEVDYCEVKGKTPLMYAVKDCNVKCLRLLIEAGADVNATDMRGTIMLMFAAMVGSGDCMKMLLDAGADVKKHDRSNMSVLCCAAYRLTSGYLSKLTSVTLERFKHVEEMYEKNGDYLGCIDMLVKSGANVNNRGVGGETPLTYAILSNKAGIARLLKEYGANVEKCTLRQVSVMEKKNEELLVAARQGDWSGIEKLVELGADVNTQCEEGKTPLILASSFGYETCVGLLICLGADVNKSDDNGKCSGQHSPQLIENMEIDCCEVKGKMPLMYAVYGRNVECVKLLIEAEADVNATEKKGTTTLMFAAMVGSVECLKVLLNAGADVNKRDRSNMSALCCAAYQLASDYLRKITSVSLKKFRHIEEMYQKTGDYMGCLTVLVKSGADVNNRGVGGETPLTYTVLSNKTEIAKLLREHGAIVEKCASHHASVMEMKNEELLVAVRQGDCSGIEKLVELGADVNTRCKEGKTPLILASSFGYETCVGLLICLGADVNKSDYSEGGANSRSPGQLKRLLAENMEVDYCEVKGKTPLMYAVFGRNIECMRLLIEGGADMNAGDMRGTTALMFASMAGSGDCVKVLLDAGADVNKRDRANMSALCCAAYQLASDNLSKVISVTFERFKHMEDMCEKTGDYIGCIDMLVKSGADVNNRGVGAETPLTYAVLSGKVETTRLLVELGATVKKCELDQTSHLRKPDEYLLVLPAARGELEMMKILVKAGANVNVTDKEGFTPLMCASASGSTLQFMNLGLLPPKRKVPKTGSSLAASWDYYFACNRDESPKKPECVKFLLDTGADVNFLDWKSREARGQTALAFAVLSDDIRSTKLLLQYGASMNITYMKGLISLWIKDKDMQWNVMMDSFECMKLLYAAGASYLPTFHRIERRSQREPENRYRLTNLCGETIRKHLLLTRPNSNLFVEVEKLPVPNLLKSFLLYELSCDPYDYVESDVYDDVDDVESDIDDDDYPEFYYNGDKELLEHLRDSKLFDSDEESSDSESDDSESESEESESDYEDREYGSEMDENYYAFLNYSCFVPVF